MAVRAFFSHNWHAARYLPRLCLKVATLVVQHALNVSGIAPVAYGPRIAAAVVECHGVVVWFDTEFSARFCAERPVVLSTSPHAPTTHWAQTLFYFKVRYQRTTGLIRSLDACLMPHFLLLADRLPSCCHPLRLLLAAVLGTAPRRRANAA